MFLNPCTSKPVEVSTSHRERSEVRRPTEAANYHECVILCDWSLSERSRHDATECKIMEFIFSTLFGCVRASLMSSKRRRSETSSSYHFSACGTAQTLARRQMRLMATPQCEIPLARCSRRPILRIFMFVLRQNSANLVQSFY